MSDWVVAVGVVTLVGLFLWALKPRPYDDRDRT